MLYLITPDSTVYTAEIGLGAALADAKAGRRPLSGLDWQQDLGTVSPQLVLDLALRHGVDARIGLVVHGGFVEQARAPERLRATLENRRQVIEQLNSIADEPRSEDQDWFREQRELAEDARQQAHKTLTDAEKTAEELTEDPVQDHLVRAWERAGGLTPAH